jgi:hypothetical protein
MSIKAIVAGAVGVLVSASGAWGQSDCNANQMNDQVELSTGRAFDDNNDGVIDECQLQLPRIRSLFVRTGGCTWDTDTPGYASWSLWMSRGDGTWLNEIPDSQAEVGLRVGMNTFQTVHSGGSTSGRTCLTYFFARANQPTLSSQAKPVNLRNRQMSGRGQCV